MTGRINHTGVVVSDIDAALDYYQQWFGGEVVMRLDDLSGEGVCTLNGLPADASFSLAFLRLGDISLELVSHASPADGTAVETRAWDIGRSHVGMEVDDVEDLYTRMSAAGVRFNGPPHHIDEGPSAGWVLAYCYDPDGNAIEIVQTSGPR